MATIGKKDLAAQIAEATGFTKAASETAINAIIETITSQLADGNDVTLVGFGSFSTVNKAARAGRNPATGETIQIAASTAAKFKAGKALKEAVNK